MKNNLMNDNMLHAIKKRQAAAMSGIVNGLPVNAHRAAKIRRHPNPAWKGRSRRFSRRPKIGPAAGSK